MTGLLARTEWFDRVGSTNDVVRDWLDQGTGEVCLAVAGEQTAGRGRSGRAWVAPRGAALLASLGFRPTWLPPDRVWQLGAIVSLAMADAATSVAGLAAGVIQLKWPNDLVVESADGRLRKLGGVLGETDGLGTKDPRAIVGIGLNTDWPADRFPIELAGSMTSLRAVAGGSASFTPLLASFVEVLGTRFEKLRAGRFDATAWSERQVTTGRAIRLERPDGVEDVDALGVDVTTGALVVADLGRADGRRQVFVGEIRRVRLAPPITASV
jgi:BirA family biotin operon repressor/biotin-[acetyl-CoA-carboxylase] ligase